MKKPDNQREEKWIRMMLNEELDADESAHLEKELESDYSKKKRFEGIQSVVQDVDDYYAASSEDEHEFSLTHDQKEELYSHITTVFRARGQYSKTEWLPQFKFALAVITGTAALVASVPLFEWVGDIERPVQYSPEGTLRPYEPPEIDFLIPRKEEPMMEVVEVFDDFVFKQEDDFDPIPYDLLPWQGFQVELGEPNLDVPEFDFEESIVNLIDADVPPTPTQRQSPVFPSEARRGHIGGRVIIEFVVDESGHVLEPHVVASTHRVFESPAMEAIRKWNFDPGEKDGAIVKVRMRMPFVFNYRP